MIEHDLCLYYLCSRCLGCHCQLHDQVIEASPGDIFADLLKDESIAKTQVGAHKRNVREQFTAAATSKKAPEKTCINTAEDYNYARKTI